MAVELAELVGQLRTELSTAMRAGEGEDLRFELGPIELELTVVVEKEAKAGGKVRFWVIDASGDAKIASTATQRVKLTLDPRRTDRPDRKPWIVGQAEDGER